MGLVDDTIVNLQRITTDAGQLPGQVVQVAGDTGAGALGEAGTAASTVANIPLGAVGDLGELGEVFSSDDAVERIQVNAGPTQPLDLSRAFGGNWSGGNGQFATRTTVERLNLVTGQIVIKSRRPGSPHLMNSDVQAAKRLFRNVAALNKRMPRKTVKESEMKKLTNAAVQAAIRNVNTDDCSSKC